MRRTLGQSLALAALGAACLTGCGSGTGTASDHPGSPASGSAPTSARGELEFTLVALLSQTAAGGEVSATAVRLDRPAAVHRFVAQFRGGTLAARVTAAARRAHEPGRVPLGAVVAVGCDAPPGVRVVDTGAGPRIVALPVRSPLQECVAAVTTVAVVSVPAAEL